MTLEEFESDLDAFGADLADWPEDRAAAARGLLDRSAAARDALAEAEALDAGLANIMAEPIAAPAGLAGRIALQAGLAQPAADILPFPLRPAAAKPPVAPVVPTRRPFWPPQRATMMAFAAMVVCFVGGIVSVQTVFPDPSATESVYVSGVYSDLGW